MAYKNQKKQKKHVYEVHVGYRYHKHQRERLREQRKNPPKALSLEEMERLISKI